MNVLLVGYVTTFLIASLVSLKVVPIGTLAVSGGVAVGIYPLMYVFSDLIQERYGYRVSRHSALLALVATLMMAGFFWLVGILPTVEDPIGLDRISSVLSSGLLISLVAFWFGDWVNDLVFEGLRSTSKWFRFIGSSVVGEIVDAGLFLGFMSLTTWNLGWKVLVELVLFDSMLKIGWEILVSPVSCWLAGRNK